MQWIFCMSGRDQKPGWGKFTCMCCHVVLCLSLPSRTSPDKASGSKLSHLSVVLACTDACLAPHPAPPQIATPDLHCPHPGYLIRKHQRHAFEGASSQSGSRVNSVPFRQKQFLAAAQQGGLHVHLCPHNQRVRTKNPLQALKQRQVVVQRLPTPDQRELPVGYPVLRRPHLQVIS